jgi:hypothetical protein
MLLNILNFTRCAGDYSHFHSHHGSNVGQRPFEFVSLRLILKKSGIPGDSMTIGNLFAVKIAVGCVFFTK